MDEVAALVDKQRNPYLTVERMSEQFDKALRVAALASVHEDFSMSSADLDELRRARETALERTTHTFDMLIRMTETRRRNLVAYQHLNLVSLGLDCMARTFPTRWGMKPPAKLGEPSGPFDLAIHPPHAVDGLVASDFADYVTPDDLEFVPSLNYCVNRRRNISFNHEVGEEYRADNFRKLRDTYEARVARFPMMVSHPRPLVLVAGYPPFFGANRPAVEALQSVHRRIAEGRKGATMMFCFRVHAPSAHPEIPDFSNDQFSWANFPMPSDDYVWHVPNFFLSDAGVRFEERIIESLQHAIEREGLSASPLPSNG